MGTISSDLTSISTCDTTTTGGTWSRINGTTTSNPLADADSKVQGTAALGSKPGTTVITAGAVAGYAGLTVPLTATFNATNKALFFWGMVHAMSNMEKMGGNGVMLALTSDTGSGTTFAATNYKLWNIDGSDVTVGGGWTNYVLDPSQTAHMLLGTGISNIAAIKTLYFMCGQRTSTTTSLLNLEVDSINLGTGITAILGDGITPLTFDEIFAADYASSWGVITQVSGIFYGAGKLNIGVNSASQTNETIFKGLEKTLVWRQFPLSATFNEIILAGYSTGPQKTIFQLGDYTPANGLVSSGVTIKGSSNPGTMLSLASTARDAVQAMYTGSVIGTSQAVKNVGVGNVVDKLKFWMLKTGAPPGTIVAKIYAASGTLYTNAATGGDYIPTGTALATSDSVTASTLGTAYGWITFTFSGSNKITLTDNTIYLITVEYSDAGSSITNSVSVGTDATTSYLNGNAATLTGTTWTAAAGTDVACEAYFTRPPSTWVLTASDANSLIKLYNSTFQNIYSAALNANTRSFNVTNCTASASTTMTTTSSYLTDGVVPGMKITGTGITGNVYVVSIQSATSLTVSTAITVSAATITFTDNSEIRTCTFKDFGAITTNGCHITDTIFQNVTTTAPISATYGLIINGTSEVNSVITNSQFINCNRAIKITAAGTYSFDALMFSGNIYDVENSSAGLVTINAINGSTVGSYINTGGGTTVINNSRSLIITGLTAGSRVSVLNTQGTSTDYSDDVELAGTSSSGTSFQYDYNWTGTPVVVNIVIIHLTKGVIRYENQSLGASGLNILLQPQDDRQYNNPI